MAENAPFLYVVPLFTNSKVDAARRVCVNFAVSCFHFPRANLMESGGNGAIPGLIVRSVSPLRPAMAVCQGEKVPQEYDVVIAPLHQ